MSPSRATFEPIVRLPLIHRTRTCHWNGLLLAGLFGLGTTSAWAQVAFFDFAAQTFRVTEGSAATFNIVRWGDTNIGFNVEWVATSGTAVDGVDFVGGTNTASFAPGETNKTVSLPLIDDALVEDVESVGLRFGNFASGTSTGLVNHAVLLIEDNEVPSLVDGSFAPAPGPADDVFALLIQPDGKILVGGEFQGLGAGAAFVTRPGVARYNADGSLDTGFVTTTGVDAGVYALAVQADGKILVGGGFSSSDTPARRYLARLQADGSLDTAFAVNVNDEIRAVVVQPDQKILIAGRFTSINGQSWGRVARLNPDGSLDGTFVTGPGAGMGVDNNVRTMVLQPDGRILIGGQFTRYGVTPRVRVARLEANGALDLSFDPGAGADDQVRAIATQADGSIYVGGDFNSYDGAPRPGLVRLLANGKQDFAFLASLRTRDTVRALVIGSDGKLLVGGSFQDPSGLARTNFARLLTNGYPDTTLLSANGPSDEVFAIARQADERIVIGGQFLNVGGAVRPRLARLLPDSRVRTVEYAAAEFLGAEASGSATITVRRAGNSSSVVLATFFTSDASALSPEDYRGVTNTLQFSPLQVTRTFSVPLVNDGLPEEGEKVRLGITNVSGAALGGLPAADLLLFDGTGYGSLSLYPPILLEDGPGAGALVVRNGPTNFPVVVYYSTRDGTALAGSDYVPLNGVFQLAPGQTSDYIQVRPLNDSIREGPEDFFLELRETPNGPLLATTRIVITDNELGIGFAVEEPFIARDEDVGSVVVMVSCTWDPEQPVEVDYATRDIGGAVAGLDYVPQSGTLTFSTNHQFALITVPILNDNVVEPLKAFAIQLTGVRGAVSLGLTNLVVTIVDNDQGLEVVTNQISIGEGEGVARVGVRRRDDGTNTVTVDYTTVDGSASSDVAGGDFTATRGTLVLPPGPQEQFLSIPIREDLVLESDESFRVLLLNPTGGASVGQASSTEVRIVDNDRPGSPDLSFRMREVDPWLLQFVGGSSLALQPDGKVLVGGSALIRLFPDGRYDTNFSPVSAFPSKVVPAVLSDGRIILGTTQSNSLAYGQCAFRLDSNGVVDESFHTEVVYGHAASVVLAPDGGIFLGGTFDYSQGAGFVTRAVIRLLPDGATDASFEAGEFLPSTVYYQTPSTVEAMVLQPDGRLVVGGRFTQAAGHACDRVARLNANGSVDSSFVLGTPGTNVGAVVLAMAWQTFDGKLLVGGEFDSLQGVARPGLTRLHNNGTVDTNFHPALGPGVTVRAILVLPDGKILVGGGSTGWWENPSPGFVVRLFPDGTLDETFDAGAVLGTISDLELLPDGDVLASGGFRQFNGLELPAVVRLNGGSPRYSRVAFEPESLTLVESNGLATFTLHRTGDTNWLTTLQYHTVAETATAGDFQPRSGQLAFLPGEVRKTIEVPIFDDWLAEPDETFRLALTNTGGGATVLLQSSAQVTLLDNERPGSADSAFASNMGVNSQVKAIRVQPDGKILIGGSFFRVNGVLSPGYARLEPDGSLDAGFARDSDRDGDVSTLALQSDGGIVLGGDFRVLQGVARPGLARLLPNGVLDPAFLPPFVVTPVSWPYINSVEVDSADRLLVAGTFSVNPESPRPRLTRLLPSGALDPSFVLSAEFASVQPSIARLADDGRIWVAGAILLNNFQLRSYLGRLLPNGAVDSSFAPLISEDWLSSVVPLPDGSVIVAGGFTSIYGFPAGHIAHLLADGSLGPFAGAGRGADNTIYAATRQPDGKLVIGGLFQSVDGIPRAQLARLNADLTLDTSFEPGSGFEGKDGSLVVSLAVALDGAILAGGYFDTVGGQEHLSLVRLRGVLAPCLSPVLTPVPGGLRLTLYVQPGRTCILQTSTDLRTWIPWATNIASGGAIDVVVPPMGAAPRQFYRVWQPGP
jgi:uncharacterized delta-60 repeat protein